MDMTKYLPWLAEKLQQYAELRVLTFDFSEGEASRLYGADALDSMQLVDFILFIEDAVQAEFGKRILLADAAAFSSKRSPYMHLGSFAAFIAEKMEEAGD
jgi:hypothetical protein